VPIIGSALSCQKDDSGDDPLDPIVGTWEIVEATGTLADVNIGTIYRYNSNGTFRIGEGILASEGIFERSTDTLSMNFTCAGIIFTDTMCSQVTDLNSTIPLHARILCWKNNKSHSYWVRKPLSY
jgi:hypothetical protein